MTAPSSCPPRTASPHTRTHTLRERGVIAPDDCTVVVSTAHGLKFTQSKTAYHASEIPGTTSHYANAPVKVKDNLGSVMDALKSKFSADKF
ncbi:hypothetical protein FOA52_001211 [Chlamydomonas sp. UWO 241]|nr:hypothetical protein FOA52_001211 [Chlamydomonas sp. UWO 241]